MCVANCTQNLNKTFGHQQGFYSGATQPSLLTVAPERISLLAWHHAHDMPMSGYMY